MGGLDEDLLAFPGELGKSLEVCVKVTEGVGKLAGQSIVICRLLSGNLPAALHLKTPTPSGVPKTLQVYHLYIYK
jgi:hypothetical protein